MTAAEFRRLALALAGTEERAHGGHPDFRVGGKVFASLGAPGPDFGMVKLTPDDQAFLCAAEPGTFMPSKGAWGERGYTAVKLKTARKAAVRAALETAWRALAPDAAPARTPASQRAAAPKRKAARRTPSGLTFEEVRAIGHALPGVEDGTSYGTPALKVKGKFLLRLREDGETLAMHMAFDERDILMRMAPDTFFITDHYRDYPAVVVRLAGAPRAMVKDAIEQAWRQVAPKSLRNAPPKRAR